MKKIRKIQEVQFDSLDELKEFVENFGNAQFYNDFEGIYYPIRIDDETNNLVIGSDAWDKVKEEYLPNIYGFQTII